MPLTDEEIVEQGSDLVADTVILIRETTQPSQAPTQTIRVAWKNLAKRWIIFFNQT